jgi:hypothetical protein
LHPEIGKGEREKARLKTENSNCTLGIFNR